MVVPLLLAPLSLEDAAACTGSSLEGAAHAAPPVLPHAFQGSSCLADHGGVAAGPAFLLDPASAPFVGLGRPRPTARQLWEAFGVEPQGLPARPTQHWGNYMRNITYAVVNGKEETHEVATRCHEGQCTTLSRDVVPDDINATASAESAPSWQLPAQPRAKISRTGGSFGRGCLVWDGFDDLASWLAGKAGGLLAHRPRMSELSDGTMRSLSYSNVNGHEEFLGQNVRCHAGRCASVTRRLEPTEWSGGGEGHELGGTGEVEEQTAVGRSEALTRPVMAPPARSPMAPMEPRADEEAQAQDLPEPAPAPESVRPRLREEVPARELPGGATPATLPSRSDGAVVVARA